MSFHDIRFPAAISFGSSGGVTRRTEIVTLANGFEERNTAWAQSRRRYDAGLGVRSLDDLDQVLSFFEARRARLHAFRWKDWLDHKSCVPSATPAPTDQAMIGGEVAQVVYQLLKHYGDGADSYARVVTKPVQGTVRVAVDGVETSAFSVDHATGVVTLDTAAPVGALVTAGFEFDVPVRFDTDQIEVNMAAFEAGDIPSVPVIEVRV